MSHGPQSNSSPIWMMASVPAVVLLRPGDEDGSVTERLPTECGHDTPRGAGKEVRHDARRRIFSACIAESASRISV